MYIVYVYIYLCMPGCAYNWIIYTYIYVYTDIYIDRSSSIIFKHKLVRSRFFTQNYDNNITGE